MPLERIGVVLYKVLHCSLNNSWQTGFICISGILRKEPGLFKMAPSILKSCVLTCIILPNHACLLASVQCSQFIRLNYTFQKIQISGMTLSLWNLPYTIYTYTLLHICSNSDHLMINSALVINFLFHGFIFSIYSILYRQKYEDSEALKAEKKTIHTQNVNIFVV